MIFTSVRWFLMKGEKMMDFLLTKILFRRSSCIILTQTDKDKKLVSKRFLLLNYFNYPTVANAK